LLQARLARKLGLSRYQLSQILAEKRPRGHGKDIAMFISIAFLIFTGIVLGLVFKEHGQSNLEQAKEESRSIKRHAAVDTRLEAELRKAQNEAKR